jgi:carboxylesterase
MQPDDETPHILIPTAEPFFIPGGPTGVLLVHGFTGSPKEMRWMGEYLAGQGCTVLGVRLSGHATRPEDLVRTRWGDWLASVEDGWHLLAGSARQIFVAGLSMGGALALLLASRRQVSGVIAMSTPYDLPPDPRLPFAKVLCWIIPEVQKGPPDWRNLSAAEDHVDYPAYPTRSIAELRDLLAVMRGALPEVKVPVLLVHSQDDTGVDPENSQKIFDRLGSQDKQIFFVQDCGHVVTREPERERIFREAANFIHRIQPALP